MTDIQAESGIAQRDLEDVVAELAATYDADPDDVRAGLEGWWR